MHASQESQISSTIPSFDRHSMQKIHSFHSSDYQAPHNESKGGKSQRSEVSFQLLSQQFFTLESTLQENSTASPGISSKMNTFSSNISDSVSSDVVHYSADNTYGSSLMNDLKGVWRSELWEPESDFDDNASFDFVAKKLCSIPKYNTVLEKAPQMDLKELVISCAKTVSEADTILLSDRNIALCAAKALMDLLAKRVSVSGTPLQRLSAYILEGLKARLLSSGTIIYKKLKCKEPTSSELMSYMYVLYQICPYWKFAYTSANVVIEEAMKDEDRIHIIDFQIAQGSQWMSFIHSLSQRPGKRPFIHITGVDDPQSAHARGGGLQLVGQRLAKVAESCAVSFEFHDAALVGSEVQLEKLHIRRGEALAINFPYVMHHIPDESVSTTNHRDRLLRLVKSLSPNVVTLVEQESNTNTSAFFQRFCETLDYYTAIFESIDAANPKDKKQRISAEEHCVARDVVNILACEGSDRVERHELFGKWKLRLKMAGFSQLKLNSSVNKEVNNMLKEYSPYYRIVEEDGALYLGWKDRDLATSSAWR